MTRQGIVWTKLDPYDEATWPPLGESVLLATQGKINKGFHIFVADHARQMVLQEFGYTHWRFEAPCDRPSTEA